MATTPWELYDRLLAGLPKGIRVFEWSLGRRWSYVASEVGCGIAMTVGGGVDIGKGGDFLGGEPALRNELTLDEMAAYVRSWRFEEASIGIAALNAYYNNPANNPALAAALKEATPDATLRQSEILAYEITRMKAKKVAVIGHFPRLEEYATSCELTILERVPSTGDLPDSACEYILPQQDLVIITGTAATNKTLPRLLQLSASARTVIAGPSSVCSELLFEYGVDVIGGALVTAGAEARQLITHGAQLPFGNGVSMLRWERG